MSDFVQQGSYAPEYTTTKVESPAPDSPLVLGWATLEHHLDSLEAELGTLENRLQASLRPEGNVVGIDAPATVPEEPSPHVGRLRREVRVVEELTFRVRRILERLEV